MQPFREKIRVPSRDWSRREYRNHKVDGQNMWRIISRVIQSNIGKPFDSTFAYFCRKYPKYWQEWFLNEFEGANANYYIDEYKNIQEYIPKNQYKGPYKVKSEDYRVVWKHKTRKYRKGYVLEKLMPWHDPNDYIPIIQGVEYEFESRKSPMYKRLKNEEQKRRRRKYKLSRSDRAYNSLIKFEVAIERQKKKDQINQEINNTKILKHGFDENSFKGEFYHGRKNKVSIVMIDDTEEESN